MKKWTLLLLLTVLQLKVWAQGCSLCSLNAKSMSREASTGLNNGILYLVIIPMVFVAVIGFIWYRRNKEEFEE